MKDLTIPDVSWKIRSLRQQANIWILSSSVMLAVGCIVDLTYSRNSQYPIVLLQFEFWGHFTLDSRVEINMWIWDLFVLLNYFLSFSNSSSGLETQHLVVDFELSIEVKKEKCLAINKNPLIMFLGYSSLAKIKIVKLVSFWNEDVHYR